MSRPDMGDVPSLPVVPALRRSNSLFRVMSYVAILMMVFGSLITLPQVATANAGAMTTSSLNLRTGPSTDDEVILVMPAGASLSIDGPAENGFYPVTYNGQSGYASVNWIESPDSNGGGDDGGAVEEEEPAVEWGPTGTRYVVQGALNLRSEPSTSAGVILVMPNGSAVELSGEISNGFSRVTYQGNTGWAYTQYLGADGGGGNLDEDDDDTDSGNDGGGSVSVGDDVVGSATVQDGRLNMRTGPGTSYGVVLVLPDGARVEIMGDPQAGFYPVRYDGSKGWSFGDYLQIGGQSQQPEEPEEEEEPEGNNGSVPVGNDVTGNLVTTSALNMRQGPATSYGVVLVLPPGTQVDIMGSAQGGFYPVRWAGRTGWSSGDWLAEVGSAPEEPEPEEGNGNATGDQAMIDLIYAAADKWDQPRADMLRVARCESNLNPRAVNSRSGASGLFQFMPSTFAFTPNGKAGQDIFDPAASADAAGWMWANGMRNHWACQ